LCTHIAGWNTAAVTNMGSIFFGATSLNCNLAAWNVLRVTNATGSFGSTSAMVDCYKRSMYDAWGATLQAAYPTWSSLPDCTRCENVRVIAHCVVWGIRGV
jgi:hypothetical protein